MLTERFSRALSVAFEVHRDQTRKGTEVPYLTHPLAVASLVLERGATEDVAIAALLHDAAEDAAELGSEVLRSLRQEFGAEVSDLVEWVSEPGSFSRPKASWLDRKNAYLFRVLSMPSEALLISVADKLHSLRQTASELRAGVDVWSRFDGGIAHSRWFYDEYLNRVVQRSDYPDELVGELNDLFQEVFHGRFSPSARQLPLFVS